MDIEKYRESLRKEIMEMYSGLESLFEFQRMMEGKPNGKIPQDYWKNRLNASNKISELMGYMRAYKLTGYQDSSDVLNELEENCEFNNSNLNNLLIEGLDILNKNCKMVEK